MTSHSGGTGGTDWSAVLFDGILGAVLAALLAAAVSFAIARYVLTRTLASEREAAAAEREQARRELREQLGIAAASRLIACLADVHDWWTAPSRPGFGNQHEENQDLACEMLRAAMLGDGLLLHDEEAKRRAAELLAAAEEMTEPWTGRGERARDHVADPAVPRARGVRAGIAGRARARPRPAPAPRRPGHDSPRDARPRLIRSLQPRYSAPHREAP